MSFTQQAILTGLETFSRVMGGKEFFSGDKQLFMQLYLALPSHMQLSNGLLLGNQNVIYLWYFLILGTKLWALQGLSFVARLIKNLETQFGFLLMDDSNEYITSCGHTCLLAINPQHISQEILSIPKLLHSKVENLLSQWKYKQLQKDCALQLLKSQQAEVTRI